MTQAVVPHFKAQRAGVIVNMASTNGLAGERSTTPTTTRPRAVWCC